MLRLGKLDLDRIAVFLTVPLLPLTAIGISTLSAGAAVGLVLAPVAIRVAVRYRGASFLLGMWLLCLIVGPLLSDFTADGVSRFLNQRLEIRMMALMLSAGVALYILLWSRTIVGFRKTAELYAVGLILEGISKLPGIPSNPWKYAFAVPVSILLLAAARTRLQSAVILTALAGINIAFESRSFAAACITALLVTVFAPTDVPDSQKLNRRFLIFLPISAAVVYQLLSVGLLNGWLGASLQDQALRQTRGGEIPLIVGARPEFAAGFELFRARPMGFGPGVVPDLSDLSTATDALTRLGVNPNSNYVRDYLFDDRLELHSLVGDLWLLFGFAGLILAAAILWFVLYGLLNGETRRASGSLGVLVGLNSLWDVFFSPVSSLSYIVLALALLLPMRLPRVHGSTSRQEQPKALVRRS